MRQIKMRQIRKLKNKNRRAYIYILQQRKLIHKYINPRGYVCYDAEELKHYLRTNKVGRPAK